MKVYLDVCCISRLTDDQSQPRIREEAEAVESVLAMVRVGMVELVSSEALEDEVRRNPSLGRRLEAEALLSFALTSIGVDESIMDRARELQNAGYAPYDALHLASAESVMVDALLSTDDRFVSRAARKEGGPRIPVLNPVSWIKEHGS